ncbi:MAG: YifB family Mg chelatase-like AAA ATPase [Pseudomonadota bacterium]
MLATIKTASLYGIDARMIDVEVDISAGFPGYTIVGLAEGAAKESKERVKTAVRNCGFSFPKGRITINLAPAWLKKAESAYDLPIALGLLIASKQVLSFMHHDYIVLGEIGLSGECKAVKGCLVAVNAGKNNNIKHAIVPKANEKEASIVDGIKVFGAKDLYDAIAALNGKIKPAKKEIRSGLTEVEMEYSSDFSEVKGQVKLKRAVEIAVSGNHNILMIGSAGCGKTMIAKRIPTIMPQMSFAESLETTKIYSIAGLLKSKESLLYERPFRSPHHTISDVGIIGGGQGIPRPGEVCLANNGVLFLDEMPEFKRSAIEVLRQPLEDKKVFINRALNTVSYPANFLLVAAMNPCPCGNLGDAKKTCTCSAAQVARYFFKISSPLLDRIDLHLEVPSIKFKDLTSKSSEETSEVVKKRVCKIRKIQAKRFEKEKILTNSEMLPKHLNTFCYLDKKSKSLLKIAVDEKGFSARAYSRVIKVARTIADMEESDLIMQEHVEEAINYRILDKMVF